jgi:hypothetical protein
MGLVALARFFCSETRFLTSQIKILLINQANHPITRRDVPIILESDLQRCCLLTWVDLPPDDSHCGALHLRNGHPLP